MTRRIPPSASSMIVALMFIVGGWSSNAQDAPVAFPPGPVLPETPQILNTPTGKVRVVPIKGLSYPGTIVFLPDGRMLVSETGKSTLRVVRNGVLEPTPITGLPQGTKMSGPGVAGVDITLHPKFSENKLVYFAYWKAKPGADEMRTAALGRGRLDGTTVVDVRELFVSNSYTDGLAATRIAFGRDSKIYVAIGAPGFGKFGKTSWAQDPAQHAGKILRLNEDGSVPNDNPFVGQAGYKSEIYALGVRNPNALVVHPETGELWENEHGPRGGDEINIIKKGANYGWPAITYGRAYPNDVDGSHSGIGPPAIQPPSAAPNMEQPFLFWVPSIAPSGMLFYSGDKFPLWRGNILVGALRATHLERIVLDRRGVETRRDAMLSELGQRIRDVAQGPDGFLYLTTDEKDGAILRIEPLADDAARSR